ncbi:E3 ubiquitin-protein ligase TRIM56-like isoform X1 [Mizuhopecten yessoensis]|uniref:E3 ubiquitin-protein ligase TRIM56-like isoform X1 n=2 Tax=Mizuhopecten yessoensis TaxID=6573 RepID=UPI000B4578EE|nr:E3 ubiquitin-protein ligase TRIM56-like isoform X1 [Mizuhopecten yessoensis]
MCSTAVDEEGSQRLFSRSNSIMETSEQTELVIPRQFLCCKLCDDDLKKPKYLPCLHTFCLKCMEEHIQANTDSEGYFPCPTCATETTLSSESVDNLPSNILAMRLLNPVTEQTTCETLCTTCKNSGNFVDAESHCLTCDNFLCKSCSDSHDSQDETSAHKTQSMDDYNRRTPSNPKQGEIIPTCCSGYDPIDIGALFCVDCDMSICADCHIASHGEHRCTELMAVAGNFEQKIQEPLSELDNDHEVLRGTLRNLDKTQATAEKLQKSLKDNVKRRTQVLCDLIQNYERLLLEEIGKRHQQQMQEIKNQRYDIKTHLSAIKGVRDFTETLKNYGTYEEKVFMRKKVGFRIRELCEEPLLPETKEIQDLKLTEPHATVETICDMFGELKEVGAPETKTPGFEDSLSASYNLSHAVDSGHGSDNDPELVEIMNSAIASGMLSQSQSESDTDMLGVSNTSENMRNVKFSEQVTESEYETDLGYNLENPKREFALPPGIQRECFKGMGVNNNGDIIIGTTCKDRQSIYVLEKHGILRGQVPVENGWNIHSVSSDGKVALTVPRGDNRFKVRVLTNDGSGHALNDSHVESFGLNFVTADKNGRLMITSNRYAQIRKSHGKSAKSGGNVAVFEQDGHLLTRITNDDFQEAGMYLLEKPQCIVCDDKRSKFYLADSGSHSVISFDQDGQLVFQYGNTDTEEEVYQGPDMVAFDKYGNVIVTDKREGRIDILSSKGDLKKSYFMDDIPRFVGATPDKLLMTAMTDGSVKFYEYL